MARGVGGRRTKTAGNGKVVVLDKTARDDVAGTTMKGFRVDLKGQVRGGFQEVSSAMLEAMARMMGGNKEGEHTWTRSGLPL
eukprot:2992086-Rhodomonas_salina.2